MAVGLQGLTAGTGWAAQSDRDVESQRYAHTTAPSRGQEVPAEAGVFGRL